ncbi:MAG: hypothetical protein ACXWLM_07250 [Myxococcales bacterium]
MFVESDLKREVESLGQLLGDTRMRFHHRQTPPASMEELTDVDREIRGALQRPLSDELQLEVRRLAARLHALDPR